MFTFALAFFAGHQYFSLHFQPLSAIPRKRKKEFGRKHSEGKPLTSTTTCVRRRVSNWSLCLLRSTVFIFSERIFISKSWGKLMNYKLENRIPWPFTDFDNIKDFPWLFPDLEKFSLFPDFSLTVATLYFLGEEYCLSNGRVSYIIEVYYIEVPLSVIIGPLLSDNNNARKRKTSWLYSNSLATKEGHFMLYGIIGLKKSKFIFSTIAVKFEDACNICYIKFDANNNAEIFSVFFH